MMKKYFLATIPVMVGVLCLLIKGIIGDEVLANGVIVEKNFFLIPLSYLFFFSGILTLIFFSTLKTQNVAK
ncbi:DUF3955 domain-containing protein [Lysinibacillus sphaericus]|nr:MULTISPECIES: DUF3955 domain-containing protein [Lysinibacillus]MBE5083924.1 DUF3955 domain-containing protein [Bacillus thuringiensis]AMO33295.1 group-specific protein [Lysinibacillus sphaericus]AMR91602.1 group-specific protein [Lysinibacillus sphaericus]ANA45649.1 group-specific protein [Lysinibacillus sphaericus]KZL45112.1 group-specific protein [Lysinibacillus sphaericus]